MIKELQSDTQSAVTTIEQSCEHANTTLNKAKSCEQTMLTVLNDMELITLNSETIATAASQQSIAAEEINQSIIAINNAALENATGAEQIATASEELKALTQSLNRLSAQFKLA